MKEAVNVDEDLLHCVFCFIFVAENAGRAKLDSPGVSIHELGEARMGRAPTGLTLANEFGVGIAMGRGHGSVSPKGSRPLE